MFESDSTKYRKKVITPEIQERLKTIFNDISNRNNSILLEFKSINTSLLLTHGDEKYGCVQDGRGAIAESKNY
ncbi:hypothetical protein [Gloeocapsa sp. PCC 73106]|uniref:hypothetical protein n=1 Tax=Gloeocapsa sp. PCC 73106 TaxID=102232 RepID=UPI0003169081|nr:hypothetical protein [Gloeocapsa sp. PCC 73106]